MNVVTAVVKELRSRAAITSLARVDKFQLQTDVSLTGLVAVVVGVSGSWRHGPQSARFPRVTVVAHADVSRTSGEKGAYDQYDRAMEVLARVDAVLHRTTKETVVWGGTGGVLVLGSERETEPSEVRRPGDTVAMLRATYDLKVA